MRRLLDDSPGPREMPTHYLRWFMIGGVTGLALALITAAYVIWGTQPHDLLFAFCPPGIILIPAILDGSRPFFLFCFSATCVLNFALWSLSFMLAYHCIKICRRSLPISNREKETP